MALTVARPILEYGTEVIRPTNMAKYESAPEHLQEALPYLRYRQILHLLLYWQAEKRATELRDYYEARMEELKQVEEMRRNKLIQA